MALLLERGVIRPSLVYLAGSLLFLVSVETVGEFVRLRRRRETRELLLLPPVLGFLAWGFLLSYDTVVASVLFVFALAFVSVRVLQRKEREWQTRVAFTAAVMFMALFGLTLSGIELSSVSVALVFLVPFTFFSAQELFVQHIADVRRLSMMKPSSSSLGPGVGLRKVALYAFLCFYASSAAATLSVVHSDFFPVAFELFLVAFPIVWTTARRGSGFKRLGMEQASLDGLMVIVVVLFAAMA